MRMKKILLGVTLVLLGFSMNAGTTNTPAPSTSYSTDYCPQNLVCIATNMTAKDAKGKKNDISGISIYKNDNSLIAIVPGHGQLSLSQETIGGCTMWCFRANSTTYMILNFSY